jgi:lipopolysaccharide transport system ATP-binding protein
MSDAIISVENLGKKYRIAHQAERQRYTALRDVISQKLKAPFQFLSRNQKSEARSLNAGLRPPTSEDFWALKDVSFEVKQGEVVGIIGRNGAGKSTLLKILSRITEPTTGSIRLRGRVASLLEVGTGFHPELTGRENIFLNGAILGMSRAEIRKKFDEIVAFAEVEKFLDTPVKRYSSGMYVRLAFAVAAHLEPEILIVDEVLAVGDAQFQNKCLGKMQDVASKEGRTVLFVSHNMAAVQGLCQTAIHMKQGQIYRYGKVEETIREYLRAFSETKDASGKASTSLGKELILRRLEFAPQEIITGRAASFVLELASRRPVKIKELAMLLFTDYGLRVAILDFRKFGVTDYFLEHQESLVIEGTIQSLPLIEGDYRIGLYVATDDCHDDFLDLSQLNVGVQASASEIIPYPAANRGVVELNFAVTALNKTACIT